jgi:dTDP-4-amino-4,6-dideoxygalactose transaminase
MLAEKAWLMAALPALRPPDHRGRRRRGGAAALRADFLTTGPTVEAFETAFKQKVGAEHAIAVANGTATLHLAMLALGVGEGDVCIAPSVTFLATANCARYVGAEVVFADVDPHSA